MNIPYDNWQFWVVTVIALWAGYTVIRPFLSRPGNKQEDTPACPHCSSGKAASKKAKKTRLTVDGRKW